MTDFYLTTPSGNTGHVNGDPTDEQAVRNCKYRKPSYSLKECGEPATHQYFPVPSRWATFLCDRHAARLKKLGCEIIKNC